MESEFMDRMLVAVKKKTGYDLDVDQLASFLDNYTGRSNKQLESALKRMIKGERGGRGRGNILNHRRDGDRPGGPSGVGVAHVIEDL